MIIDARTIAEVVRQPSTTLEEAEDVIAMYAKSAASWALAEEAAKRVIELQTLISKVSA